MFEHASSPRLCPLASQSSARLAALRLTPFLFPQRHGLGDSALGSVEHGDRVPDWLIKWTSLVGCRGAGRQ